MILCFFFLPEVCALRSGGRRELREHSADEAERDTQRHRAHRRRRQEARQVKGEVIFLCAHREHVFFFI